MNRSPKSAILKFTIYPKHPSIKLKKGAHITLQAGYKGDVGLLSQGKITSVTTRKAGVDKVTSILFSEGIDYSDKKRCKYYL